MHYTFSADINVPGRLATWPLISISQYFLNRSIQNACYKHAGPMNGIDSLGQLAKIIGLSDKFSNGVFNALKLHGAVALVVSRKFRPTQQYLPFLSV